MAPFLVGGSSMQGSPTPAVSPWGGFAQGLGMLGSLKPRSPISPGLQVPLLPGGGCLEGELEAC